MKQPDGQDEGGRDMSSAGTWTEGPVTISTINSLKLMKLNQEEIARLLGKAPARISQVKHAHPDQAILTPIEQVRKMWPWGKMATHFHRAAEFQHLKRHSTFYACGRKGLSDISYTRLVNFYNMLREHDYVIGFDPNLAPYKGMPSGGFYYARRGPFDRDLMIRVDENVVAEVDDHFIDLWSFPSPLPAR
jgi:hypothetical protein